MTKPFFCISVQGHLTKTLRSESSIVNGNSRINGKHLYLKHGDNKFLTPITADFEAVSIEDVFPFGSTSVAT